MTKIPFANSSSNVVTALNGIDVRSCLFFQNLSNLEIIFESVARNSSFNKLVTLHL